MLLLCALGLGSATALTLTAFQDNLVFFRSPSDIAREAPPAGPRLPPRRAGRGRQRRAGSRAGRAARGALPGDGRRQHACPVTYAGVLPDLFREGQGVVTLGKLGPDGVFRACEVLARHDETYMPPEVADALKRSGHWNPAEGAAPPAATWNTPRARRATAARERRG